LVIGRLYFRHARIFIGVKNYEAPSRERMDFPHGLAFIFELIWRVMFFKYIAIEITWNRIFQNKGIQNQVLSNIKTIDDCLLKLGD